LCLRKILRTIALGILLEANDFSKFYKTLGPKDSREEVLKKLHDSTVEHMLAAINASQKTPHGYFRLLGVKRSFSNAFTTVGGMTSDHVFHLLIALWEDRQAYFKLCSRGMLPNVLPMLFTLCHLMTLSSIQG
jgi:hypothetical protein